MDSVDLAELVTPKDLEWLVGDWSAKSDEAEVHTTYQWDDDKGFLRPLSLCGTDQSGSLANWQRQGGTALPDSEEVSVGHGQHQ
ncbi:MAG: hypothetical protein ACJ8FY_29225 [Gemmataceae bacterium]